MSAFPLIVTATLLSAAPGLIAFDLVEARPLTERIVEIQVKEGHIVYHGLGQAKGGDQVVGTRLDGRAAQAAAWTIIGPGGPIRPTQVGRKSNGSGFAWYVDRWDAASNRAVNDVRPDHVSTHRLYLSLDRPLEVGGSYTATAPIPGLTNLAFTYDPVRVRSEAVHVSLVGMDPEATAKFAYVSAWLGDQGGLDLSFLTGRQFHLIDARGATVFSGPLTPRLAGDQPETWQMGDTPKGNFSAADVWQCDFSAWTVPGSYTVAVEGIGASYPLHLARDIHREAFTACARALYHQRSGLALVRPYTNYERPAPHHPGLTPGFTGRLQYTRSRFVDWKNPDSDPADKKAIESGIVGPLDDAWGWYQDAGDWDGYFAHFNVPTTLLFAYETAPGNFADRDLNLPESGNGVPDLLDEATWLPRWGWRVRHELLAKGWGTGGIGSRVCGDHFGSDAAPDDTLRGSWQDTDRTWIVSGEDPWSTFRYAGVCAQLAYALRIAKATDPHGIDWQKEAGEAYDWATTHSDGPTGLATPPLAPWRAYAAAGLYRLTGKPAYEAQLGADTADLSPSKPPDADQLLGPSIHCLGGGAQPRDTALVRRLRTLVLDAAERNAIGTTSKRAMRFAGDFGMPMLVGQQTTPWVVDGIIGEALTRTSDPTKARAFRAAVATTADYFLGGNPLNLTWVTGIGPNPVRSLFHLDAWANGTGRIHPGLTPYGPWRKEKDLGQGPWDHAWPYATLFPGIDAWPGAERWFDNRNAPMTSEFTIHQNICYTAATYGWLCAPRP